MGSSLADDETGTIANRIQMDFSANRMDNTHQKLDPYADSGLGMSADRTMLEGVNHQQYQQSEFDTKDPRDAKQRTQIYDLPTGAKKSEKAIDLIPTGPDDDRAGDDYGFYKGNTAKNSLGINKFDSEVGAT